MLVLIVRAFFMYVFAIFVMRIMGKREIGQLQPYEFAITLIISELLVMPMENTGVPLIKGVVPVLVITISQLLFSYLSVKNENIQRLMSGTYTVMVANGKLVEENLRKQNYNITELMQQLRLSGADKISDVEYGILETSGQLSVILKPSKRPATAEDLLINKEYEGMAVDIILDGKIVTNSLNKINMKEEDVIKKIKSEGYEIKDIFYASVNGKKEFYIQKKGE